jgi:hypothetical protein
MGKLKWGRNFRRSVAKVRMCMMAFIRKRGHSYYLVHNVRKRGRVEQLHLACLGRRPHINEDVIKGVHAKHPFVQIDWKQLTEKFSDHLVLQPLENNSQYLRDLVAAVRSLHFDLADLPLPVLDLTKDAGLSSEFISGLKLLRGTLDVKLNELRRIRRLPLRGGG